MGNFLFDFIERELVTKKVGETFTVEHSFEPSYQHKSLAGKTAHFTVTIVSHEVLQSLPVGLEYAQACGFESLDALKKQFRANLEYDLNQKLHLYHKRVLLDALSDIYNFDLPESMVKSEFDVIWSHLKAEMDDARKNGQLSPEDDKSEEELTKEYRLIAERRVRLGLLIAEISQKENIRLTDKMIQDLVIQEAMKYRGQERQVIEYYRSTPKALETITAPALEDLVVLFIINKIEGKEENLTKEDLRKRFVGILPGFEEDSMDAKAEKPKAKAEKKEKPVKAESASKIRSEKDKQS